jgi:hypothetical protein
VNHLFVAAAKCLAEEAREPNASKYERWIAERQREMMLLEKTKSAIQKQQVLLCLFANVVVTNVC